MYHDLSSLSSWAFRISANFSSAPPTLAATSASTSAFSTPTFNRRLSNLLDSCVTSTFAQAPILYSYASSYFTASPCHLLDICCLIHMLSFKLCPRDATQAPGHASGTDCHGQTRQFATDNLAMSFSTCGWMAGNNLSPQPISKVEGRLRLGAGRSSKLTFDQLRCGLCALFYESDIINLSP